MKHQHNFQIQAMICFAALLLCACAAEETTGPRETTQRNTLPTVEKAYTLPETDWEGRTFSMFGVADFGSSMFAAEEIGEPVNDAKFDMMRTVEEALNITLEETLAGRRRGSRHPRSGGRRAGCPSPKSPCP